MQYEIKISKNMIKTHTAQSLGKYIYKEVKDIRNGDVYTLIGINAHDGTIYLHDDEYPVDYDFVELEGELWQTFIPILKPYEKLLEPMLWEGETIIPIEYVYNAYMPCRVMHNTIIDRYNTYACNIDFSCPALEPESGLGGYTPDIIEKLINLGFGAIEDEESPTGYVDLFGYVCEVER